MILHHTHLTEGEEGRKVREEVQSVSIDRKVMLRLLQQSAISNAVGLGLPSQATFLVSLARCNQGSACWLVITTKRRSIGVLALSATYTRFMTLRFCLYGSDRDI